MFPRSLALILLAALAATLGGLAPVKPSLLHATRMAADDLEITGMVSGLAASRVGYLSYEDLLALPQTKAVVTNDPDYPGAPLHVSGVSFETLAKAVGALPESDLVDGLCEDRYRSHFPARYIATHHPLLVLTVDGMQLSAWAKAAHQYDPSPYVVMYQHFVPSFRVLTHADQEQLPDNLVRLNFTTQAATFGPIAPRGELAPSSAEEMGFAIAKQNCLRCHFMGATGGTKSGRTWQSLGAWAAEQPQYFEAYVKDPAKIEPHAHMPGNLEYDAATLGALTAYFRMFAETSKGVER